MTPEQIAEQIREHYRLFWSDAPDALVAAPFSPGFVDHGLPPGTPPGPEPVLYYRRVAKKAFPDMVVSIDRMVSEGNQVAVHVRWRGVHAAPFEGIPPSGVGVTFTGMVFWRFESGLIAERWAILDLTPLRRAAGG